MPQFKPRGIKGLEGREPVGGVLSVGIKGDRGQPVEKDRFHVLEPFPRPRQIQRRNGPATIEARQHHPRFAPFNTADPERRRTVSCQLVHQDEEQCWQHHLKAYQVTGQPMHPMKLPFCVGDGERARRYRGNVKGEHVFDDIACPNDRCEFRIAPRTQRGLGPTPCKPWGRLLFRIVWKPGVNMPSLLLKWSNASWNSCKSVVGFFELLHQQASMVLGNGRDYTLAGFTFDLTLGEKANKERRSRFPVVSISPTIDPVEFFAAQVDWAEKKNRILGPAPVAALPAPPPPAPPPPAPPKPVDLIDESETQSSEDYRHHMPGVGTVVACGGCGASGAVETCPKCGEVLCEGCQVEARCCGTLFGKGVMK